MPIGLARMMDRKNVISPSKVSRYESVVSSTAISRGNSAERGARSMASAVAVEVHPHCGGPVLLLGAAKRLLHQQTEVFLFFI